MTFVEGASTQKAHWFGAAGYTLHYGGEAKMMQLRDSGAEEGSNRAFVGSFQAQLGYGSAFDYHAVFFQASNRIGGVLLGGRLFVGLDTQISWSPLVS